MTETARLRLPVLEAAQSQKHVTHNEALTALDTLVQAAVLDKDLTAPPGAPQEGDCYIVGSPATGAWTSWEKRIARYQDGQWISFLPGAGGGEGWLVWVQDEDAMYRFDGADWSLAGIQGPQGPQGPAGADGADGADGAPGQGIEPDATGTLAERDAYDGAAQGFVYLRTDVSPFELYVKASAASGDWAGPSEMGASMFTGLADTPAAYTGAAGKLLAVTAGADGVEFVDAPTGGVPADLDLLLAQLALNDADALNVAQFLGESGNRVADSFDALTYVDAAGSTNLDTGTAGLLKPTASAGADQIPTMTGATTSGVTISASGNTGSHLPWHAGDKNNSTYWESGDGALPDWLQVQFGAGKTIASYKLRASTAPTYTPKSWTLRGSNTGAFSGEETTLDTQTSVANWSSGEERSYTIASPASFVYYRLNVTATEANNYAHVAEWNMYVAGTTDNMIALSAVLSAAAAPDTIKAVSRVNFVDSITLGTDLTFEVSRDGGTTWTAATMNDRFTAGGLHVLESDDTDVSGQPSGTAVKWRIKTLNNKMAEINDMYTYWV